MSYHRWVSDSKAMKRVRELDSKVKVAVEKTLWEKVRECGIFISSKYPFIAGSPDGICDNKFCIEIKCPTSDKTYKNYLKGNKVTEKYIAQMHLEMLVTNLKNCYFCVAGCNFEVTNHVEMHLVEYDKTFINQYLSIYVNFGKIISTLFYMIVPNKINVIVEINF